MLPRVARNNNNNTCQFVVFPRCCSRVDPPPKESIEKNVDKHYPAAYEYSWKDAERVCVESRELFGDLVSVLQVFFNETVSKDKVTEVASDVVFHEF